MQIIDEAGRDTETVLRAVQGMLARLLAKKPHPVRKTAQGMEDAADPNTTPAVDDADPKGKKLVGKKTKQDMREAQLSEAGQNGLSFAEIGALLQDALKARCDGASYVYIRDIFPTTLVYTIGWKDELKQCAYTISDDGSVVLGDPICVVAQTIYLADGGELACPYCGGDVSEVEDFDAAPEEAATVADLTSDIVPLQEAAVANDGTARIKLIAPGWGSSGYYSEAVLKRDGTKAFPKGTKMYWDHPTSTEEAERPERSLRDLAAQLTSDAQWHDDPTNGPGLYADATVFPAFRESVDALASHIGTSIRAMGRAESGEAEGRQGAIITQIANGKSVDFVTVPGAGGKVLSLFESARSRPAVPVESSSTPLEEFIVNEHEAQALRESNAALQTQVARLLERELLREARAVAESTLAAIDLPVPTRQRLVESLSNAPVIVDGQLDRAAFVTTIQEAATAEQSYLASLSESGSGKIVGMGAPATTVPTSDQIRADLANAFGTLGLSESAAQIAANGR